MFSALVMMAPFPLSNWQTKGGASSLISRGAGINCKRISSHSAGTSAPNQKILVPVDSELFHLPDRYGYDANRSYGSRLRAQRAALESAAAFRILMAACSLYIAHDSDIVHCMPRWELALANAGVKHDEIALYRRSELCDFTPHYPRAGVVFKPEALFLHLVPYFLTANVPVWFSWDMSATTTQYAHGFDSKYKPTALDVQEIAVPSPSSTAVNAISPAPAPIPCSGQLVGEDPDTYRARCLVRRQKSMEKETPEQKLAREQREKQHRTPSQPGKKGPLCWLWEKQEGGWWLKNPVSRNAVEDAWPMWAPEQMFYDSIRNEWNICEEWAPDARAPIEDDYEFNDRDDDYPLPQAPPLSMSGRNWNTVHLWHDHCAEDHEDRETLYLPTRSLLDVLEDRFGFLAASTELPGEPKLSWDVTRRTLVDQTADVPLHVQRRVSTFVSLITTDNLPSLPADTWDITCDYGEWAAAKFFSLQMDRVNGDHFYTINSINGPHRPWRLVTSSATTALHCFRETYAGGDTREVVELLVSMGIPFQTFIEGLPRGGVRHPAVSLARRSHGHQCQVYEYAEYERVLRDFLRRPYARAAILQGGIVWRLAVSVFGLKEANERVTLGPSRDVNNHVFMLTIPGHRHLYDDVITEKEMELICGVYKEYTGNILLTLCLLSG